MSFLYERLIVALRDFMTIMMSALSVYRATTLTVLHPPARMIGSKLMPSVIISWAEPILIE